MLTAAVDALIVLLLLGTAALGLSLHRRLGHLRQGGAEVARLIESLNEAVARAETAAKELRRAAADAGERVTGRAQHLCDDLRALTARADRLAGRLGTQRQANRPRAEPATPVVALSLQPVSGDGAAGALPAAAELEQALRALR